MSVIRPFASPANRGLPIALLAALVLVASWLWSGPWRQERRLRTASLAQLQSLACREPDNARVFYHLGVRARQENRLDAAYDAFTHAADLSADDEPSWLAAADLAGRLHGSQGEFDLLSLFLRRHPGSAPAHVSLARFYHRRRVYLSAFQQAKAAALLEPRDADAWRAAGSEAMLGQSYPEAEAALRRAVALRPQDWANQVGLGDALRALGRSGEAVACYRQALALAPAEPIPAVSLARALLGNAASSADLQEARRLLRDADRRPPQTALTALLLGQSAERLGHWREAQAALEEAARRDPHLNEVHFELGRVAQSLGDMKTAAREQARYAGRQADDARVYALRLHVAQAKDDVNARLTLARLCLRSGSRDEAAFQCRQVLARQPGYPPARALLEALLPPAALTGQADTLRARGRWAAARSLYTRALVRDHAQAAAAQGIGLCFLREAQPGQAFPFLLYAVRRDPRLPEAQAALAGLYRAAGFADEARRRLTLAIQAAPDRADWWHALGLIEGESDAHAADAERSLARAAALAPSRSAYRLDLAEQEEADSRTDAAEADYRRALAGAPHDADALSRLGGFLVDTAQTASRRREAEELLRQALAQDPANQYARCKLGRLALDRGDSKGAAAALSTVVAESPDIAEAWYSLGRAWERLGKTAQAARALGESRRLQQEFQARVSLQEQVSRHPRDAGLRLRLARLYAGRGEPARALYEYEAARRLAPENRAVQDEGAALTAKLKAAGRLPAMRLYAELASQIAGGAS